MTPEAHGRYRTCVGKLIHLSHHRSDIQHAVHRLCKKVQLPLAGDWIRLKKLARYLAGTRNVYLKLSPVAGRPVVEVYTDADWADKKSNRRSTSGGALMYYGCPILTWSRGQASFALSSAESELYAIGTGAVEALGFCQLLKELGVNVVPTLFTDAQSALDICKKRGPGRMKHVELKFLAVQEWQKEGKIKLRKINTSMNPSDMLAKVMDMKKLTRFGRLLALRGDIFDSDTHDHE